MNDQKTTVDLRSAKAQFSRIGFALLAFFLAAGAVQYLYEGLSYLIPALPGVETFSAVGLLGLSFFSMYAVGLPVCLAVLRKTEHTAPPAGARISAGRFFGLLTLAVAFLYAGNYLGLTLLSFFPALENLTSTATNDLLFSLPLWAEIATAVLIGPFFEELIFRKLLLDRTRMYGEKLAILFSALMFGFFHGNFAQFFYTVLLGLLLGYIYLRTGHIWTGLAIHAVINLLGGVLPSLLLGDLDTDRLFSVYESGNTEAILAFFTENETALLGTCLFGLVILAANISGWIFLSKNLRRMRFYPAQKDLPHGEEAGTAFTGIGVILYILFSVLSPLILAAISSRIG